MRAQLTRVAFGDSSSGVADAGIVASPAHAPSLGDMGSSSLDVPAAPSLPYGDSKKAVSVEGVSLTSMFAWPLVSAGDVAGALCNISHRRARGARGTGV